MVHTAISLIDRFVGSAREGKISAADLARVGELFEAAPLAGGLDAAFGLEPGWAKAERTRERDQLLSGAPEAGLSVRAAAARERKELLTYASTRMEGDRRHGAARRPEDAGKYRIMALFNWRVPSFQTLRDLKSAK
jgi:hypothetical protein